MHNRSALRRILPPHLFIACIVAAYALNQFLPWAQFRWKPTIPVLPTLLIGAGVFLAVWASRHFRKRRTNIHTFREPDSLVTDGPFRISRNPMYLGMALALLGVIKLLGSISPLLVLFAFVVIVDRWYIPFEERWMRSKFQDTYVAYQARTRRWI